MKKNSEKRKINQPTVTIKITLSILSISILFTASYVMQLDFIYLNY